MSKSNIQDEEIFQQTWDHYLNCDLYNKYLFIKSIYNLHDFVEYAKYDSDRLKEFKKQLVHMQFQKYIPMNYLKKSNLIDLFSLNEKINLSYKKITNCSKLIRINRENILQDSINELKKSHEKVHSIRVEYIHENGVDMGGLTRDWFTNVSQSIIESNIFKPVPNGTSFEFNMNNFNRNIIEFAGKLFGLAFVNRICIPLKLTSSIWKFLFNEKITLDDMNDYDSEICESLKWISENDPEPMMMTFVNSENQPLCQNGSNIMLNNENKERYIELIIFDILINKSLDSLRIFKGSFNSIVSSKRMSMFLSSNELKTIINGNDFIDVNDWKNNFSCAGNCLDKASLFFDIISNWSQEKLAKLLNFITGSPIPPINGFSSYSMNGGKIQIKFNNESNSLPISHTCFNTIVLPNCADKEILENKLLMAIECERFLLE